MQVFDFENYIKYLQAYLKGRPKQGYGEMGKIAISLRMHPTALSQVLNGSRDLSMEQGALLCDYLHFSSLESDYFLVLLQIARSGNTALSTILRRQALELKTKAKELVHRIDKRGSFGEAEKAIFYSQWYYCAISLLTMLEKHPKRETVVEILGLPRKVTNEAIDFLVRSGICLEERGLLKPGIESTHVEASSPLSARHHANWRIKAIERFDRMVHANEFAFTAPLTLSASDVPVVRAKLLKVAQELRELVTESGSEVVYCLNFDWFSVK